MNNQYDELASKISSERMYKTIQDLQKFGPRIAGTHNDKRAREYITACLMQNGLMVSTEEFPIMAFDKGSARILIKKPYEKKIPALPLIRSISTAAGGVSAPLRYAGSGSEEDFAKGNFKNSIVLVDPPSDNGIHQAMKLENAVRYQAAGLIQYGATPVESIPSWGGPPWGTPIPAITIAHKDGKFLKKELETKDLIVRFEVDTSLRKSQSANIISTLPGRNRKREIIMVSAHHDTVMTTGANDNGSGVAVALELAMIFYSQHYDRTLMFVFFGAEEGGDIGAEYFVKKHQKDLLSNIRALINLDMFGAGPKLCLVEKSLKSNKWLTYTPWLNDFIRNKGLDLGYQVDLHVNFYGTGDEGPFADAGIPSCWILKPDYPYYHTEEDNLEKIKPNDLEVVAHLIGACLLELDKKRLPVK